MALQKFWKNYKVLIVMGTSLGLIHWGWYNLKTHPLLHKPREDYIPEPGIVSPVMRSQSWIRRNWFWAAGGAFVSVHMLTWILQRAMKHSVRSEVALKHKPEEEEDEEHRPA